MKRFVDAGDVLEVWDQELGEWVRGRVRQQYPHYKVRNITITGDGKGTVWREPRTPDGGDNEGGTRA